MITVWMLGKHKTYLQKAAASLEMAAAELENRMKRMRCEDGSTMWSTPGWSVKLDSWQHSKQIGLRITTHFIVLCVCVCVRVFMCVPACSCSHACVCVYIFLCPCATRAQDQRYCPVLHHHDHHLKPTACMTSPLTLITQPPTQSCL